MTDVYYKKELICPVCLFEFQTTKIKMRAVRVKSKDADFCTYYENYNPIYYEIFICPRCGYGASERSFDDIREKEKRLLKEAFAGREVGRDFGDIRTYKDALDSFKIALFTADMKESKNSIMAGLALKVAWMYRYKENENEYKFLHMALDKYKKAFDEEIFSGDGGIDELTVIYLIGEISRRLGNYAESMEWFNRLLSHPERNRNIRIEKLAREQWRKAREIMKK